MIPTQVARRLTTGSVALFTLALAPLTQAGPCATNNNSLSGLANDLARSAESLERVAQATMGHGRGNGRGHAHGKKSRAQSNGQFLAALDRLADSTGHIRQAVIRNDHSFSRLQGEVHEVDQLFDSISSMSRYFNLSQPVRIQMNRTKSLLDAFHQNLERNHASSANTTRGSVIRGGGYRTTSYGGAQPVPRVPRAIPVEISRRY